MVEIGGRWHSTVPRLVRRLAKEYVASRPALRDNARNTAAFACARWAARLSSILIQGNAAILRATQPAPEIALRPFDGNLPNYPHCIPEGDCEYELLCVGTLDLEDA